MAIQKPSKTVRKTFRKLVLKHQRGDHSTIIFGSHKIYPRDSTRPQLTVNLCQNGEEEWVETFEGPASLFPRKNKGGPKKEDAVDDPEKNDAVDAGHPGMNFEDGVGLLQHVNNQPAAGGNQGFAQPQLVANHLYPIPRDQPMQDQQPYSMEGGSHYQQQGCSCAAASSFAVYPCTCFQQV